MAETDSSSKVCATCRVEKHASCFPRNKARGLRAYCKPCNNAKNKAWRDANPEKSAEMSRRWALSNPAKVQAKKERWAERNPGRMTELQRAWIEANPERARENARRYTSIPVVRLHRAFRERIRQSLKKGRNNTFDLLGYTREELVAHIERQFTKGMDWGNYGSWHVDHIRPLSSFTIEGPHDPALRLAWALTNLRPLWAKDNMSKGPKRTHLI